MESSSWFHEIDLREPSRLRQFIYLHNFQNLHTLSDVWRFYCFNSLMMEVSFIQRKSLSYIEIPIETSPLIKSGDLCHERVNSFYATVFFCSHWNKQKETGGTKLFKQSIADFSLIKTRYNYLFKYGCSTYIFTAYLITYL